ncbi:MAG: amino acid adenylation domain-containing protein, partial [Methyloligellaceae bacterium]
MYLESHIASTPQEGSHVQSASLLHELFEIQAATRSNHVAVEAGNDRMTYAELDKYSNQIAQYLRNKGVKPGVLVGIYLTKSVRLYAAILGVLKAGAGYIPIDPKFPMERVNDILTDSEALLAISEGDIADELIASVDISLVRLDQEKEQISMEPVKPILPHSIGLKGSDVCYVIYTSGSTGHPKGVMIEHRNALSFVSSLSTVYHLTQNERIYQGFSVAFDASVEEIWAAFSLGGTLVVPEEAISRSPLDTARFIEENNITFFSTIPTFLAMIDHEMPSLTTLILGGEVCTPELVQRWARPGCRMLNTYGPTETTVIATWAECYPDKPVTIGTPIPGYEAYVLDKDQKPVRMGEVGELYVGGPGVARGYCNRADLTAERFVQNPFKPTTAGDRVYRTFDLVRVNEQGQIEFVGRSDGQIKIRGFRVELPEIESVLIEQENIRAAAVRVVEKDGIKDLAAYVVTDHALNRSEISESIRARLPEYMIPKYLDIVSALPLTNSGKVDRDALPAPVEPLLSLNREIIMPSSQMEQDVLEAWKKCLGLDTISVEDDFFDDLQGHSLAAAKVTSELRIKLGNSSLSVRDVYRNRTIRDYAKALESNSSQLKTDGKDGDKPDKSLAQVQFENVPVWERCTVYILQAFSLLIYYGILFAPVAYATTISFKVYTGAMTWGDAAWLSTILAFAWWPAMLVLSIIVKWTVIGRFKPGRYPVWGLYYYRWWLVTLVQKLNWAEVFVGTPLMNIYYRSMGASIGRNVVLDTNLCNAFDVVSVG